MAGFLMPLVAEEYDIDKEISRTKKEITRVEAERKRVKSDRQKDQKEFVEYQNRTKRSIETFRTEIDSIRAVTRVYQRSVDSIAGELTGIESAKREYDLRQENLRIVLMNQCDSFAAIAKKFPPLVSANTVSSILFLKSEFAAKGIYNIEGMNRLVQIANDMEDIVSGIQVVQESSPVPDIRGTVYRIRIGCVFEGIVDEKGTKAAVWNGFDRDGKPLWHLIADPAVGEKMAKAVQVREGKSLPDFIELPFVSSASDTGVAQ